MGGPLLVYFSNPGSRTAIAVPADHAQATWLRVTDSRGAPAGTAISP
jgi:hypothetical protein